MCVKLKVSLAGVATSIIFVTTKLLSRQSYACRDKRRVLSPQTRVCRDKSKFVATKVSLSPQKFCRDKHLSQQFFQVGYPVDTHTHLSFLLRVSVTHRPALARSSLVDGRNGLFGWNLRPCQSYKGYPDLPKESETHSDTLAPSAKMKTKEKNLLHKKPSRKRKGNQQKRQQVHTNPQQDWIHNKCRRGKMKRTGKKSNRIDNRQPNRQHGEKKGKTWGTVQLLNYQQIPLPSLTNKTNTRQKNKNKNNENNREKSKSRKVNRNSTAHILDLWKPGFWKNSSTLSCHGSVDVADCP